MRNSHRLARHNNLWRFLMREFGDNPKNRQARRIYRYVIKHYENNLRKEENLKD